MTDPIIANNTLEGFPQMGKDIGDFLKNMAPGLGAFLLVVGLFVAIVGIIVSIGVVIRRKINV